MARPRGTDSAKVIQVIITQSLRGDGQTKEDPCRCVTQYWDFDGRLLAEDDPTADGLMADDWETLRMISHKKDISSEEEISEFCKHRGDGYPYSILDKYYLPISKSKREEIQNVKTFNWAWMVFASMITALITVLLSTVLVRL